MSVGIDLYLVSHYVSTISPVTYVGRLLRTCVGAGYIFRANIMTKQQIRFDRTFHCPTILELRWLRVVRQR